MSIMSRRKQANPRPLKELPSAPEVCRSPPMSDTNESSSDTLGTDPGCSWQSDNPDEPRTPPTPSTCETPNSSTELPESDLTFTLGVTESTPYPCQFCNKAFPRQSYLKKHEQTHGDHMPFQCEFCSRLFKHKRSRDRHVKLHTGDKKYRCSHCDAAFSRSDHLKIHLRTHDNGKPFQCLVCNRGYNTAAALTSHMQNHKKQQRQLESEQQEGQPAQATLQCQQRRPKSVPPSHPNDKAPSRTDRSTPLDPTVKRPSSENNPCPVQPAVGPESPRHPVLLPNFLHTDHFAPTERPHPLPSRCEFCRETIQSAEQYQAHLSFHKLNTSVRSPNLKRSLSTSEPPPNTQEKIHRLHNPAINLPAIASKLVCIYCTEDTFVTMDELKAHVHYMHQSIINGNLSNEFLSHLPKKPANHYATSVHTPPHELENGSNSPQFCCDLCTMRFTSLDAMQAHIVNVHRLSKTHICPFCSTHFESSDIFAEHCVRVHRTNLMPEQIKPTDLSKKPSQSSSDSISKRLKSSNEIPYIHAADTTTPASTSSSSTPNQYDYPSTLLCNQCDAAFPDFESFRSHLKVHLEQADNFRNIIHNPPKQVDLQKNRNLVHEMLKKSPLLSCPHCTQTFKDPISLERHICAHFLTPLTEYICKSCSKTYPTPDELQKHLVDFHSQQLYRCSLCQEIFDSKVALQVHMAVKHSSECQMLRCMICPSDVRSTFRSEKAGKVHIRTNHDTTFLMPPLPSKAVRCHFCLREFETEMEMQLHLTVHFQPYKCPICQKTFQVEYLLECHMKEHQNNSQVNNGSSVMDGNEQQSNSTNLAKTSDMQFSMLRSASLILQGPEQSCTKVEAAEYKNNNCDICERNDFSSDSELAAHRKLVHHLKSTSKNGVVSLHCAYCNENCKSRTELENHMKTHSQSSGATGKHKCNICDELCPSAALLAEHKLTHCKVVSGNCCTHCKATLANDEQFYAHLIQHNHNHGSGEAAAGSQIPLPTPCVICRQTLISTVEVRLHSQFHLRNSVAAVGLQCVLCAKPAEAERTPGGSGHICKECYTHHSYSLYLDAHKADQAAAGGTDAEPPPPPPPPPTLPPASAKKYACIKCQLSFDTHHEIQTHVASHLLGDAVQHECHLCRSKLSTPLKLQVHLIEHTFAGFGSYTCYLCSAVFTAAQGLHSHMLEHGLAARPYDCPRCCSKFFFRAELDNHSYSHIEHDSLLCGGSSPAVAAAAAATAAAATAAADLHFNLQLLQCSVCHLDFADMASLLLHAKTHTRSPPKELTDPDKKPLAAPDDSDYIEVGSPARACQTLMHSST